MTQPHRTTPLPLQAVVALADLKYQVMTSETAEFPRESIRVVAREVGSAARLAELLPEQLVVAVKETWSRTLEMGTHEERHVAQRVLTEVVSLCIREYYRNPRDGGAQPVIDASSGHHGGKAQDSLPNGAT